MSTGAGQRRRQDLQRDGPSEPLVGRAVDATHAPPPDFAGDRVRPDHLAFIESRILVEEITDVEGDADILGNVVANHQIDRVVGAHLLTRRNRGVGVAVQMIPGDPRFEAAHARAGIRLNAELLRETDGVEHVGKPRARHSRLFCSSLAAQKLLERSAT